MLYQYFVLKCSTIVKGHTVHWKESKIKITQSQAHATAMKATIMTSASLEGSDMAYLTCNFDNPEARTHLMDKRVVNIIIIIGCGRFEAHLGI